MSEVTKSRARHLFNRARRGAVMRKLVSALTGAPNELLVYDQVRHRLRVSGLIYRGIQAVPLASIQGSVDRFDDFDRAFLPRQTFTEERWERVGEAHFEGIFLPPVHLYQVDEVYFVMDGNHRVSVARSLGQEFIDAEVYEAQARVPVTSGLRSQDVEIIGEKLDFMDATGIERLRPDITIEVTQPGGYYRLLEHIRMHRYWQSQEWGRPFTMEEAVTQWADQVYAPVVALIREHDLMEDFPDRTETDLYLWLNEHLFYLKQAFGDDLDEDEAIEGFIGAFSPRPFKRFWRWLRRDRHYVA